MSAFRVRRFAITLAIGTAVVTLPSCVVPGPDGYGYGGADVGIGVDYYEPYGIGYGGWGPGYRVGPYRDGGHPQEHFGGRPGGGERAYRGAPASRAMPSIPSHPHSGGGGGGGGGGEHRH